MAKNLLLIDLSLIFGVITLTFRKFFPSFSFFCFGNGGSIIHFGNSPESLKEISSGEGSLNFRLL